MKERADMTRRELLRGAGRWVALSGIAGGVAILVARKEVCSVGYACAGCGLSGTCSLKKPSEAPQAAVRTRSLG
jgi:hypothetical protein